DPAYAAKATRYSRLCRDVSEFLADLGLAGRLGEVRARVTYQDPCHLAHGQGIRRQPRDLLRRIPGIELVEMPGSDRCCGSAGIYNLIQPGYSRQVLDEKMAAVRETGAALVVAPNPGCMLQIASGIRAHGLEMQVRHLIELLDRAYEAAEGGAAAGTARAGPPPSPSTRRASPGSPTMSPPIMSSRCAPGRASGICRRSSAGTASGSRSIPRACRSPRSGGSSPPTGTARGGCCTARSAIW